MPINHKIIKGLNLAAQFTADGLKCRHPSHQTLRRLLRISYFYTFAAFYLHNIDYVNSLTSHRALIHIHDLARESHMQLPGKVTNWFIYVKNFSPQNKKHLIVNR